MKTIILFLFTSLVVGGITAQKISADTDSWKIVHNRNLMLHTSVENSKKNVISIKIADLKKSGYLWVNYTEVNKQKGWRRVIALVDDKENELLKRGGNLFKVTNPHLRSIANHIKTIHIYTWALPTDPKVAATVRIRRVHLCTVVLK
ncbi:MAG: hypothetical protein ABR502_06105 [Chitinophagaceae bacterium]